MVLGERLAESRKRAGKTQVDLAVALGRDRTLISHIEAGRNGLLSDGLAKAATELGVSADYLLGLTDDPTPAAERSGNQSHSVDEFAYPVQEEHSYSNPHAIAQVRAGYNIDEANDQDGIWNVPIREVRPAAGSGAEVFGEEVVGYVPFRRNWLVQHDIDPAQADIVQVSGDSMEPTLPDGCSILVDRKRREIQPKHVYVLRNEDGLVVKRVDRNRDGWWVLSDNPSWLPLVLTEGTDIIGEVRWCGHTF